jgi:hypothetical protein
MGHRGMFITESVGAIAWPEWFVTKWEGELNLNESSLSSKFEMKYYGYLFESILEDIQTVIKSTADDLLCRYGMEMVYLHECGGVTKFVIFPEEIKIYEPELEWRQVKEPSHMYCYGCWKPHAE